MAVMLLIYILQQEQLILQKLRVYFWDLLPETEFQDILSVKWSKVTPVSQVA